MVWDLRDRVGSPKLGARSLKSGRVARPAGIFAAALVALVVLVTSGCRQPKPAPRTEVAWRRLGSWSGQGNAQSESFTSDTGSMRVQWKTSNEASPGTGTFRLIINSAISGRPLLTAVDRSGTGSDVAYVQEDPRVFFAVVESANLDWSFTIEEAVSR
jgi:hypothetical protein